MAFRYFTLFRPNDEADPTKPSRFALHLPWMAIALLYIVAYLKLTKFHGIFVDKPVLWAGWADQSQYLRSAKAFAASRLDASDHWYPFLYPLLGAPFVRVMPATPFVLVDLACIVAAFLGFARVARRFGIASWVATPIFAASTILYPEIGRRWLEPWTTTVSAALIWLALAGTLATIDAATVPPNRFRAGILGCLLALIPMARPGDVVVSAVLGVFAIAWLARSPNFSGLAALLAGGFVASCAYLALHLAVYGLHLSNYALLSAAYGLNFWWIGWKAYLLLVEPMPWFPDGEGLLEACPWLVLGAAGLILTACRRTSMSVSAVVLGLAILTYSAFVIAYVDLLPSGLWRFENVHYFKWMLPAFALFAVIFVRDFRFAPIAGSAALIFLMVVTSLRLIPVHVSDDQPARMVIFDTPTPSFNQVYFARSTIVDRGGELRNLFEFHQLVANASTIEAIALKRDFTGRERWMPTGSTDTKWPIAVSGQYSAGMAGGVPPKLSMMRLAPHLSFGLPCWLPPYPCGKGKR